MSLNGLKNLEIRELVFNLFINLRSFFFLKFLKWDDQPGGWIMKINKGFWFWTSSSVFLIKCNTGKIVRSWSIVVGKKYRILSNFGVHISDQLIINIHYVLFDGLIGNEILLIYIICIIINHQTKARRHANKHQCTSCDGMH